MKNLRVSILLPVYNGERFIQKSIESVLIQSFKDFELLIIDDGSSDGTEKIVKEFERKDNRVRYIKNNKNLGIQKTLNRGLKEAKGEYIARIDDDDRWIDADKLSNQVLFLDEHSDYGLIGTGVIVVDEFGKELFRYLNPAKNNQIRKKLLFRSLFIHSSVLFRKSAVLSLGGYGEGEDSKHIEDYDLWLSLGVDCKLANLSDYATEFMLRDGTISATHKSEQFRKIISLILKYKSSYPHGNIAVLNAYFRRLLYALYKHLPLQSLKVFLLKIYKKS